MNFPGKENLGKWRQCSTCVSWGGGDMSLFFSALHHIKSTKATKESSSEVCSANCPGTGSIWWKITEFEKTKAFSSVWEKNWWWQKKCLCSTIVWVWKCQILLTKTQELCPSLCFWLWWQSNREAHLKWWKKASNPWVTLRLESSLFISQELPYTSDKFSLPLCWNISQGERRQESRGGGDNIDLMIMRHLLHLSSRSAWSS